MMNPPKRVLKAQLRKHAERPAHSAEEKRQGHALVVDPGCWLGSKNRQALRGFEADPRPMLVTIHASRESVSRQDTHS